MDFIVNCFQDIFSTEFVAKFLVIKTDTKISGLSLDFFEGRVWPKLWPRMAILCEVFLCVIDDNLITCCVTPPIPVRPDWRIRTGFEVQNHILGLLFFFFFFLTNNHLHLKMNYHQSGIH